MDMTDPLRAKAVCHLKYLDAVAGAGGIPVVVPPYTDASMLDDVLSRLDGFCLIGGPDYDPEQYGGHAQLPDDLMHPRRHKFDMELASRVLRMRDTPILGVCGGHQLISIASGGALIQDIRSEWTPTEKQASTLLHSDDERKDTPQAGNIYRHEVSLAPESLISKIVGDKRMLTNSYHHQAVRPDRIGDGLKATAWAPDGVIEAIESADSTRFLLGVQWHPERQTEEAPHRALFKALVDAASRK